MTAREHQGPRIMPPDDVRWLVPWLQGDERATLSRETSINLAHTAAAQGVEIARLRAELTKLHREYRAPMTAQEREPLDPAGVASRKLRSLKGSMPDPHYDEAADLLDRLAAENAALREQVQRVEALPPKWDERADDYTIVGADGVADGLNEALFDLDAALAGEGAADQPQPEVQG